MLGYMISIQASSITSLDEPKALRINVRKARTGRVEMIKHAESHGMCH